MCAFKLKTKQIAEVRAKLIQHQGGTCSICQRVPKVPCLDHNHDTGAIRGVLCNTCNAIEGRFLKMLKRYGIPKDAFLNGLPLYLDLHKEDQHGLIHPTFKTPEEKKVLAKKRRAKKLK